MYFPRQSATTEVLIPWSNYKATNLGFARAFKLRFFREMLLHRLGIRRADLTNTENLNNYVAVYHQRLATMDDAGLAEGKKWYPRYITDATVDDEIRKRSQEPMIVDEPNSPRAMVTKLVDEFLQRRPDIRSAANIGAFVDTQCAWLAPRHPSVSFLSVDRHGDIARLNAYLPQSPNWSFADGYPLDMLADGTLSADLYFMTSTSVCFTQAEFSRYVELFARAKAVIFNEPWWPSLTSWEFWRIPRPENIDPKHPLIGLAYFNFQHNYIHWLERHGFKVTTSRIVPTAGGSLWYTLQIVAER